MMSPNRRHERSTAISTTQKSSEKTIRHATISHGPVGLSVRKYSGRNPQRKYAQKA